MPVWVAILIGCSCIAVTIFISTIMLVAVLAQVTKRFEGLAHLFLAVSSMQLRLELRECGYKCPEWLKGIESQEVPTETGSPMGLHLVKTTEDK